MIPNAATTLTPSYPEILQHKLWEHTEPNKLKKKKRMTLLTLQLENRFFIFIFFLVQ